MEGGLSQRCSECRDCNPDGDELRVQTDQPVHMKDAAKRWRELSSSRNIVRALARGTRELARPVALLRHLGGSTVAMSYPSELAWR
mgnify:CR=1 FL=1